MYATIRDAFHPRPKGYPTKLTTQIANIAAIGNRNTSVLDRNGSALIGGFIFTIVVEQQTHVSGNNYSSDKISHNSVTQTKTSKTNSPLYPK